MVARLTSSEIYSIPCEEKHTHSDMSNVLIGHV